MKRTVLFFVTICSFIQTKCQNAPYQIDLNLKFDTITNRIKVKQSISWSAEGLLNKESHLFYAWANSFKNRKTALNESKLEENSKKFHFAESKERGQIFDLKITSETTKIREHYFLPKQEDVLKVVFDTLRNPLGIQKLELDYTIKLPHDKFTRYGINDLGHIFFKYFDILPVLQNGKSSVVYSNKGFNDISLPKIKYNSVKISGLENYYVNKTNPEVYPLELVAVKNKPVLFSVRKTKVYLENEKYLKVSEIKKAYPKVQQFLEQKINGYQNQNLFLSQNNIDQAKVNGIDPVDVIVKEIVLFRPEFKTEITLLKNEITYYLKQHIRTNYRKNHWMLSGFVQYLTIQYVQEKYSDLKLVGAASKLPVLKWLDVADLHFNERYNLLYQYLARKNLDQPINIPLDELGKLNRKSTAGFKLALGYVLLNEQLNNKFNDNLNKYISHFQNDSYVEQSEFIDFFSNVKSEINTHWFFDDFLNNNNKYNFKIKGIKIKEDSIEVRLRNIRKSNVPILLSGLTKDSVVVQKWYQPFKNDTVVYFPNKEFRQLGLNHKVIPEIVMGNNYVNKKGLFKNAKNLQLRLIGDYENPRYNQLFFTPEFSWNNYDKFLLSLSAFNNVLLEKRFKFKLEPTYSFGTQRMTGKVKARMSFLPENKWISKIYTGGGFSYFHYDEDLTYQSSQLYSRFYIRKKKFRSAVRQYFNFNYSYIDREVPEDINPEEFEFSTYHLFDAEYYFANHHPINDINYKVNFQWSDLFSKISLESYYRTYLSKHNRIGMRFIASAFLSNKTESDYFDIGVSSVNDYLFRNDLLGRSETEGLLSQQYILADAGFKSNVGQRVNAYIAAANVDVQVWKPVDIYLDFGWVKNKTQAPQFLYDTGVRFRFIPDFLEFYFPIQSSLGFEPTQKAYLNKVRFVFTFNIGRVIDYARRGWY